MSKSNPKNKLRSVKRAYGKYSGKKVQNPPRKRPSKAKAEIKGKKDYSSALKYDASSLTDEDLLFILKEEVVPVAPEPEEPAPEEAVPEAEPVVAEDAEPAIEAETASEPAQEGEAENAAEESEESREILRVRAKRRLSINALKRYAKTSAKGSDAAIREMRAEEKKLDETLKAIRDAKTPADADDATKAEYNDKRAALRKDRDALKRSIAIKKDRCMSLSTACDEYEAIISFVTKEEFKTSRKEERLNERHEYTVHELKEIVERLTTSDRFIITKEEEKDLDENDSVEVEVETEVEVPAPAAEQVAEEKAPEEAPAEEELASAEEVPADEEAELEVEEVGSSAEVYDSEKVRKSLSKAKVKAYADASASKDSEDFTKAHGIYEAVYADIKGEEVSALSRDELDKYELRMKKSGRFVKTKEELKAERLARLEKVSADNVAVLSTPRAEKEEFKVTVKENYNKPAAEKPVVSVSTPTEKAKMDKGIKACSVILGLCIIGIGILCAL